MHFAGIYPAAVFTKEVGGPSDTTKRSFISYEALIPIIWEFLHKHFFQFRDSEWVDDKYTAADIAHMRTDPQTPLNPTELEDEFVSNLSFYEQITGN